MIFSIRIVLFLSISRHSPLPRRSRKCPECKIRAQPTATPFVLSKNGWEICREEQSVSWEKVKTGRYL